LFVGVVAIVDGKEEKKDEEAKEEAEKRKDGKR
jgi:hypothetical protein